jgi:D-alanine-D-alanine ligase
MKPAGPLTVTVLLGGPSAEREVSLKTGTAVALALRTLGHVVHEVDPRPGEVKLPQQTDVVFLALHGTYGEDGTVQRELEALKIPYTGCGPETSQIAFDKVLTKQRCLAKGVPTARYLVVNSAKAPWPSGWQPPVVLKPVRQGSSVGLRFVEQVGEWEEALAHALSFDTEVVMEEKIIGRETTVAILDGRALPVVEIRPKEGAYDYRNKYTSGRTEYFCPAPFDPATTERIQEAALGAFQAIGGGDYARVDVMVHSTGVPFVLEVNTLPGMTETSLLPKAAKAAGLSYGELCESMIELALRRASKPHDGRPAKSAAKPGPPPACDNSKLNS